MKQQISMPDLNLSSKSRHSAIDSKPDDLCEFVCGSGAASINILATFPMNKMIFRQQLYGVRATQALNQLCKEGLFNLYRGLLPPLLQKNTSISIMFGTYHQYQRVVHRQFPSLSPLQYKSIAAILAGCTEAILTPFERVQTLLQDKHSATRYRNTFHAFHELKSFGAAEYYRGLTAILLRNGPSNVLFFLLRGKCKEMLPHAETMGHNALNDFISGALLGATISTIFYPVNVIKTKMQATVGGEMISLRQALLIVYHERDKKWKKIYRGVQFNFYRALISWGIINAAYEFLKKTLF